MTLLKHTFSFTGRFKNVLSLGGGHITASLSCGDPPVLFDPGVSAFGPLYLQTLRENAPGADSVVIALSHAHFDHCGAAAYLKRKLPGAAIAASPRAAEILNRPNAVALICRLNAEYEQAMAESLKGEDVSFTALPVDLTLREGDRIPLSGGLYCEVIETPGHTRDSISYFLPEPGVLVTGDAAGACEGGFMHSPFLTSYEDYMASLEKLFRVRPAALCIAHSGILSGGDVPRYLEEAAAAARAYKQMIERYLNEYSGDEGKVVERIAAEEYDSRTGHIQKRRPFILNLEAKVSAVVKSHRTS